MGLGTKKVEQHEILRNINKLRVISESTKVERISAAYKAVNEKTQRYTFVRNNKEKMFQTLQFLIYEEWFSNLLNVQLKNLVYAKVYPETQKNGRKTTK